MRPRIPLPPELAVGPFLVAEGRARGLRRQRLAGPSLARPYAGLRLAADLDIPAWQAFAPLLRETQRFSHLTAVVIRGGPVPRRRSDEVHVSTLGKVRVRRPGVIGHNHVRSDDVLHDGFPVSGPVATFVECARELTHPDLVAVGDFLTHAPRFVVTGDPRPFVTHEDLIAALAELKGPSIEVARAASMLVRPGAESAPETHLRLLVVGAGLPEPEVSVEIHAEDGRRIGWFDLGWQERRVLLEYDGDQHRTSTRQYDKDIRRFDDAAAAGWTVVRVRSTGLYQEPDETLRRIRRALADS